MASISRLCFQHIIFCSFILFFIFNSGQSSSWAAYQLRDLVANDEASFIKDASEWTISRYEDRINLAKHSNCSGKFLLGGFGILGSTYIGQSGQYFKRTYNGLPGHKTLRFSMSLWMLDEWESTDYFQLSLDSYSFTVSSNSPVNITYSSNVCGGPAKDFPEYKIYGRILHSSESLTVTFSSNLNQLSTTKSFGIRDINLLSTFNSDSPSVICPNPNAPNFDCTCTIGEFYYFKDCQPCSSACEICFDGFATHCYLCKAGRFFDGSTCDGKCHSSCSICNGTKPTECVECNPGYVMFRGICRLPCSSSTDYLYYNDSCYGKCLSPRTVETVGTAQFCIEDLMNPNPSTPPIQNGPIQIETEKSLNKSIAESTESYIWIVVGVSIGVGFLVVVIGVFFFVRRRKLLRKQVKPSQVGSAQELSDAHLKNIPSFARDIIERPPCISHMMDFEENQYFDNPISGERGQIMNHKSE